MTNTITTDTAHSSMVLDARLIRTAAVLMCADKVREPICRVAVYEHQGHAVYVATDSYGMAIVHGAGFGLTPTEICKVVTGGPLFTLTAAEIKNLGKSVDLAKLEGKGDDRVLRFGPITVTPSWDVDCYPRLSSIIPSTHEITLTRAVAFQARRMADMDAMGKVIESGLRAKMRGVRPWMLAHATTPIKPSVWTYAQEDCGAVMFLLMPVRCAA